MLFKKRTVLLFLLPSLIGFAVFYIIPFIGGMYYCFVKSAFNKSFIGLDNIIYVLRNEMFLLALKNTLIFSGVCVPLIVVISLLLALLLQSAGRLSAFFRGGLVLPLTIPVASVVLVWQLLFHKDGYVNHILSTFFGVARLDWLESNLIRWPVTLMYIWRNCGYNMVIFLAGLLSIPPNLYEAAALDGAGRFITIRRIIFPLLFPSVFFVIIISIINSFKIFKEAYLIGGSYPPDSIYYIQHYINNQFNNMNYEKLTSAAYVFAFIVYLLVLVIFKVDNHLSRET